MRSESCEMEKNAREAYLRKRFGRNIPQAKTRFPPGGAMRNVLPDKLVYLQATPRTTNDLANAAMPRPTARPEAAYSAELERRVKAKEFNLKAGIGKVQWLGLGLGLGLMALGSGHWQGVRTLPRVRVRPEGGHWQGAHTPSHATRTHSHATRTHCCGATYLVPSKAQAPPSAHGTHPAVAPPPTSFRVRRRRTLRRPGTPESLVGVRLGLATCA